MIDTKELRRLALDGDLAAMQEIVIRLKAAEKERDALRNEIACVKEVEFPRKAQAVADAWKGKCERLEAERDALRAALQHEADCVEAAKAEIEALRAKVEAMERQEPSHWGCTVLQSDGRWKEEVSREAPPEGYFSIRDIFPLYALPGAKGE